MDALREICQTYDIDGIELDYWRHLVNFPEMLRGQPVTPKNLKRINQLMRDIRRMSEEEGLRRGRPILTVRPCASVVRPKGRRRRRPDAAGVQTFQSWSPGAKLGAYGGARSGERDDSA